MKKTQTHTSFESYETPPKSDSGQPTPFRKALVPHFSRRPNQWHLRTRSKWSLFSFRNYLSRCFQLYVRRFLCLIHGVSFGLDCIHLCWIGSVFRSSPRDTRPMGYAANLKRKPTQAQSTSAIGSELENITWTIQSIQISDTSVTMGKSWILTLLKNHHYAQRA